LCPRKTELRALQTELQAKEYDIDLDQLCGI